MRIVALEEHVIFPEITALAPKDKVGGFNQSPMMEKLAPKLADVTGERLDLMNKSGISVQVLSVVGLGANVLSAEDGPAYARKYNDLLAEKISAQPDRFAAFAHLPTSNPKAAAEELERTVKTYHFVGALINGLTNGEFLDDAKYAPILQKAEELGVPIYLHPGLPPKSVLDAYYSDLPGQSGATLSVAGWGWHSETAIHTLRLIISGTFDKYPKLKLIIGHMGEMLPMMMVRCDGMFRPGENGVNQRTISQTLKDQVYITTSGIFTQPPLKVAIETFGIDNIMFSVDYPFSPNEKGKEFLDQIDLPVEEKEKIAYKNADRILGLKA
ncbi:amidohydrolase family protein [Mucilaginibacter sp.]